VRNGVGKHRRMSHSFTTRHESARLAPASLPSVGGALLTWEIVNGRVKGEGLGQDVGYRASYRARPHPPPSSGAGVRLMPPARHGPGRDLVSTDIFCSSPRGSEDGS